MHSYVLELLECPACHGKLAWEIQEQDQDRIENAVARCQECGATYPVHEGIGVFLTPDLPRDDLWDETGDELSRQLKENPQLAEQLIQAPLFALTPADRFLRAMVLEEQGHFEQARAIYAAAKAELYRAEHLICQESQVDYLIDRLVGEKGPVVDLASGLCEFVQEVVSRTGRPVIATDYSLRVLRRDRRWLEHFGQYASVSLLAFDARRMPFKNGSVRTMTSNLGLATIRQPGALLDELRRVVAGQLLAIMHFYPPDDAVNAAAIAGMGLSELLYSAEARRKFAEAGWRVLLANPCAGKSAPVPKSALLDEASIDSLPVSETELEWCILIAT
jgi:uncharacterized protein YbaR (Trm112 family)